MDRLVQASLVLVLEPIFEADFKPCQLRVPPKRRTHDAIAEIHHFGAKGYHWVLDADIDACFDNIGHSALMDRVRRRIRDKRVLALVKAFLKAGIMSADGAIGTRTPARPRVGSPRRCWPTSPCRRWMNISRRNGTPTAAAVGGSHRKRGGAT